MKKITINYFAKLRDERGLSSEVIETEANNSLELYQILKEKYNLSLSTKSLKVAINDEFCGWNDELKDNDNIVFIPPVAGG